MEKKIVNQKEYLKKYLSSGKDKKKAKKKKPNLGTKTVKIIDDDISLKNMRALEDGELDIFNNTEDGPQIAGIVDERGPVDFSDKKRWKIVTDDWDGDITVTRVNRDGRVDEEESSPRNKEANPEPRDDDFSPPRRSRKNSESDDGRKKSSKKRRSKPEREDPEDSDFSPPRKSKKGSDSDETNRKKSSKKRRNKPEREDPEDSDLSPPRKAKKDSDSDLSPPRNSKSRGKDRRKDKSKHSQRRGDKEDHRSARSRSSVSPAPRGRNDRDDRRNDRAQKERKRASRWKDRSPSPQNRRKDDPERSKPRSQRGGRGSDSDLSPPRENRNLETEPKKKTSENYQEMSEETTGFGQAPVYRDRKTGRRRDFAAEAREQGEKDEKRQELEEKYAQWGRGLKQVEDRQEKLDRDLYEMSKPLARYADDADLERELKAQDREGDPMLAYMRRKHVKEGKQEPETPKYRGPSMPNRFGIRPGYRWDGVDRSNGYEKKWFEAQNARKAVQEEAYKWSTADM